MALATMADPADNLAGIIHRAIKEEPYEIRKQDGEGDPQC
jgi:hypothetical protein